MGVITIKPYSFLKNKDTGDKISCFSVIPFGNSEDWEIVTEGYTWGVIDSRGSYTEGLCRAPAKTLDEAIAIGEKVCKVTGAKLVIKE